MTTIAIVGRPNVGKSALFNRLLRKRIAIVDKISGVTRDRLYGEVEFGGRRFTIIDTGGMDLDSEDTLKKKVLEQIKISIAEADLVLFVVDVTDGLVPLDKEISRILHHSGKDVIVTVNKVDNEKLSNDIYLFSGLGWDNIVGISAIHGLGIDKVLEIILKKVPGIKEEISYPAAFKVAIIGKPNVGKSTFVNAVLNQPRMIVDEKPGTTRDAVDIKFIRNGNPWLFIDTAGMRKRRKLKNPLEYYSVRRAYTSIDRADVVILMIDGWEGIGRQDAQLLDYIIEKEKPCIIAINKWDLVTEVSKREYRERVEKRLSEHWYIPAGFVSALKKENLDNLLDKADDLFKQSRLTVPTKSLNKLLQKLESTRTVRIYYGTQVGNSPLRFLLFSNIMPDKHYINYVKNNIHEEFNLEVPIRVQFRPRNLKNLPQRHQDTKKKE